MKKILFTLTCIFTLCFTACSASGQSEQMDGVFRVANWGDSIDDVKKAETAKYINALAKTIMYSGEYAGHDAFIIYQFDDGFTSGNYGIKCSNMTDAQQLTLYDEILTSQKQELGTPTIEKVNQDGKTVTYWKQDNVDISTTLDSAEDSIVILYMKPAS